jgi:hypothetical protein
LYVPLGAIFSFSGEAYDGLALGGLGGGASLAVVVLGLAETPLEVAPVHSSGGWVQLKAAPTARVSFNAAYGLDAPDRAAIRALPAFVLLAPTAVVRNAGGFVNAIVQARSNLLFSIEYRRLWTTGLDEVTRRAQHFSFTTGIGF